MGTRAIKTIQRTTLSVVAAAAMLGGAASCKGTPTPTPQPEPSPVTSAGSVVIAPSGSLNEAPVASAKVSASALVEAPPPAQPTAFYLIAEGSPELELSFLPGKDAALLLVGIMPYEIRGDRVTKLPHLLDSLRAFLKDGALAGKVDGYLGRWPSPAYASVEKYGNRGGVERDLYLWDQKAEWKPSIYLGLHRTVTAVTPVGDAVVALSVGGDVFKTTKQSVMVHAPGTTNYEPQPAAEDAPCDTRIESGIDVAALSSGEIFIYGNECGTNAAVVERFEASGKSTGVSALPAGLRRDAIVSIVARSSTEAYVAGGKTGEDKPYFVRWDGKTWAPEPTGPFTKAIAGLTAASDGTLWAVSSDALWKRPSGGKWEKVAMPDGAVATAVYAPAPDDIWALGKTAGAGVALFRTKPLKYVMRMGEPTEPRALVPATPDCATPFVLMYKVTSNAAPDYDFPLTRQAMAGHTELAGATLVVTGDDYFGALVPSHDIGEKLVALVKGKVKGAKPQLVCMSPTIREEIPIDLETGKVKR